jgi:ATP-binding cassette subfamily B protein
VDADSAAGLARPGIRLVARSPTPDSQSLSGDPAKPVASNATLIARLVRLGWIYRWQAVRVMVLQSILLALALAGLGFIGLGIDVIRAGFDSTARAPHWPFGIGAWAQQFPAMGQVFIIAGLVIGIAAIRFIFDRTSQVWKGVLVQDIVTTMRSKVYDKLQRLSFRFFDANESGSIINRVTGDVQAVRMFVDGVMIEVLMLILSLAFFLIYMLNIHVGLTIACLATTPAMWLLTAQFGRRVKPAYRRNRLLFDNAVRILAENVQGVHVVKGFSRQQQEVAKFHVANREVQTQKRWIFSQVAFFGTVISFIPQINLIVLLLYGGWLVIQYESGRGDGIALGTGLFVFAGLLQQFSNQVGNIANIANTVQQSLTGAQRVFEVLDAPVEITSPPDAVRLERARGSITFENVSFAYRDTEAALTGINLHVNPGQTVAILGATGSGKSTLLSLIPRFYDPNLGRVRVDGVDVRKYEVDDLRRNIGIVFQESFLFSNTVAANIAFGHPDATREQVEKAARIASAHDFIMELPKGYDTMLSEGGGNLSGGQRQRLAIARAVLLEPPILLLDDPTAAIDPETEHEILQAMNQAMQGRTTLVVAHRLSTLRRADTVIVLDHGRIVQQGTHDELMAVKGHYRWAARMQLADGESRRLLGMEPEGEEAGTV